MSGDLQVMLRSEILRVLASVGSYLMPERALKNHVQIALPHIRDTEIEIELAWLEREGYAAGISGELGGGARWRVTDKGKLALAELQG
jgi:hypothetical protein